MPGRPLSYTGYATGLALAAPPALLSLHRLLLEPLPELLWGPLLSSVPSYSFNRTPALFTRPHAPAVRQDFACETAGDVRNMDRSFFLNDTAYDVALRIRTR